MSLNVELLRSSFELVVERSPHLTHRFYEILFERYPETQSMFAPSRRQAQESMLTSALVAVMDHLEDAPWLQNTLQALGAKHVAYGVTNEMYDWVGASLLAALAEACEKEWTNEVEQAWVTAFGAISGLMKQGAALADAKAPAPVAAPA